MKNFLLWLGIVIATVVIADVATGIVMKKYMTNNGLKGDYRAVDYLLNSADDDLIVLGSSVALNSIDTKTLSDSLSIKAYNGGSNGQYMPYYQTLLEILADKTNVKTIILGTNESNFVTTGLGDRYKFLAPYYGIGYKSIDRRMEGESKSEKIFLNSSLYRYNTSWFRILLYHFFEPGVIGDRGFIAKEIPSIFPTKDFLDNDVAVSDERSREMDEIVNLCKQKGIDLIVCVPPNYVDRKIVTSVEKNLRNRAKNGDFTLWFDAALPPFINDSTLFYDTEHLNLEGARKYTQIIIDRLRAG